MRGPNDDNLQFPINGIFTIQLLNWKGDSYHIERSIEFDDGIPIECRQRVITGDRAAMGSGIAGFVSNDQLLSGKGQYLDNDRMCYRISYTPLPPQTG